ncbi:MAG: 3-deoxy-8-phosphooctulonate synthase [bacterium]|nr:3-deoxy-8-phosphooctulonate synthase [bacterium]
MKTPIEISSTVQVGHGAPLLLIAGPCVLESRDFTMRWAERLAAIIRKFPFGFVFKASYDKANRTSAGAFRGPGLDEGLKLLEEIRKNLGVPVLTDVHESPECAQVAEVVDVLQIPAFLCRQTSLLEAAGATGKVVNIKKGQFLHADDLAGAAAKVKSGGSENILLTERGSSFGYRELVVDFRNLARMRALGYPAIFDGTHSVQRPGGAGGATSGDRNEVPGLVRAAVAHGVDGVFLEAHPDPDHAPSDGPNMLTPELLEAVLSQIERIDAIRRKIV